MSQVFIDVKMHRCIDVCVCDERMCVCARARGGTGDARAHTHTHTRTHTHTHKHTPASAATAAGGAERDLQNEARGREASPSAVRFSLPLSPSPSLCISPSCDAMCWYTLITSDSHVLAVTRMASLLLRTFVHPSIHTHIHQYAWGVSE